MAKLTQELLDEASRLFARLIETAAEPEGEDHRRARAEAEDWLGRVRDRIVPTGQH
jgi:hypothetical protein